VRVQRDGASDLEGTALDLTGDGHLVVRTGSGDVAVAAGDVVHLRVAASGDADRGGAGGP
jgi:BirA family biotin operon repressor/biotin-[acetyl-CoA-carboxylase] ligase